MVKFGGSDHLRAVMQWHFGNKTGSPFWLEMRGQLGFDPIKDVQAYSDLAMFPDISHHLREVSIEDLKPSGLQESVVAGVYESGGTTGAAKRLIAYEDWFSELVDWRLAGVDKCDGTSPRNTLAVIPTGPHIVGAINQRRAKKLGGQCFTVDLDPRWVKKLIQNGDSDATKMYVEHLVDQAEEILTTQSISYLIGTPPLLEALAKRRSLSEYLNNTLETITWGGTHMDVDTLEFLQNEVFPNVTITASYGSTMILSDTKARSGETYNGALIFDSFAPYVLLDVVDMKSLSPVENYQRGRVVMSHLSKYALIPNTLERDTAIRVPRTDGMYGASVSDVMPLREVEGAAVIEGVY